MTQVLAHDPQAIISPLPTLSPSPSSPSYSANAKEFSFTPASPLVDQPESPVVVAPDRRASSSPFPSPGSSFLPPPIPGAHEFAIKTPVPRKQSVTTDVKSDAMSNTAIQPARKASAGASTLTEATRKPHGGGSGSGSGMVNGEQPAASSVPPKPAAPPSSDSELGLKPNGMITIPADLNAPSPPITPKPSTSAFISPSPSHKPPPSQTEESPTTPTNDSRPPSAFAPPPSTPSRNSLTSSRPAPPSPAQSRRTSAALTRSRPSSATLQSSSRRTSRVPQDKENVAAPNPATAPPKRKSVLVKIRDFAFASSDPRHTSTGPDTPRPTRRLQRPISSWSQSSVGSSANGDDDEDAGRGWGLSWGLGRLSWFNRGSVSGNATSATDGDDDDGSGPSANDFARNFDVQSPENEDENPYESWGAHNDADELSDEAEGDGDGDGDGETGELPPGMYRALYAFEPEGTAEMALEEDQVVHIIGRGGGVGWAVALRENGEHALVPEGYLELIQADEGPASGGGEEVR